MPELEELRSRVGLVYSDEVQPAQIEHSVAMEIGRQLVLNGFKQTHGYLPMNSNSEMKVKDMIRDLDSQRGASGSLEQTIAEERSISGPYFEVSLEGESYCLPGIAIWEQVV